MCEGVKKGGVAPSIISGLQPVTYQQLKPVLMLTDPASRSRI